MGQHKDISGIDIHVIHRWVVADAATRLALSVGPEDVGKIAKQETPLSFWVLTDDDPLTWVEITAGGGGGGVFGTDYQSVESLGESSTSADVFQDKVEMVTPALIGTYRVGCSMRTWHSNVADSAVSRLYNATDDDVLCGEWDEEAENSTNRRPNGGFANVVFAGASKTFKIQYKQDRGGTAYINQARIELWRVA